MTAARARKLCNLNPWCVCSSLQTSIEYVSSLLSIAVAKYTELQCEGKTHCNIRVNAMGERQNGLLNWWKILPVMNRMSLFSVNVHRKKQLETAVKNTKVQIFLYCLYFRLINLYVYINYSSFYKFKSWNIIKLKLISYVLFFSSFFVSSEWMFFFSYFL